MMIRLQCWPRAPTSKILPCCRLLSVFAGGFRITEKYRLSENGESATFHKKNWNGIGLGTENNR